MTISLSNLIRWEAHALPLDLNIVSLIELFRYRDELLRAILDHSTDDWMLSNIDRVLHYGGSLFSLSNHTERLKLPIIRLCLDLISSPSLTYRARIKFLNLFGTLCSREIWVEDIFGMDFITREEFIDLALRIDLEIILRDVEKFVFEGDPDVMHTSPAESQKSENRSIQNALHIIFVLMNFIPRVAAETLPIVILPGSAFLADSCVTSHSFILQTPDKLVNPASIHLANLLVNFKKESIRDWCKLILRWRLLTKEVSKDLLLSGFIDEICFGSAKLHPLANLSKNNALYSEHTFYLPDHSRGIGLYYYEIGFDQIRTEMAMEAVNIPSIQRESISSELQREILANDLAAPFSISGDDIDFDAEWTPERLESTLKTMSSSSSLSYNDRDETDNDPANNNNNNNNKTHKNKFRTTISSLSPTLRLLLAALFPLKDRLLLSSFVSKKFYKRPPTPYNDPDSPAALLYLYKDSQISCPLHSDLLPFIFTPITVRQMSQLLLDRLYIPQPPRHPMNLKTIGPPFIHVPSMKGFHSPGAANSTANDTYLLSSGVWAFLSLWEPLSLERARALKARWVGGASHAASSQQGKGLLEGLLLSAQENHSLLDCRCAKNPHMDEHDALCLSCVRRLASDSLLQVLHTASSNGGSKGSNLARVNHFMHLIMCYYIMRVHEERHPSISPPLHFSSSVSRLSRLDDEVILSLCLPSSVQNFFDGPEESSVFSSMVLKYACTLWPEAAVQILSRGFMQVLMPRDGQVPNRSPILKAKEVLLPVLESMPLAFAQILQLLVNAVDPSDEVRSNEILTAIDDCLLLVHHAAPYILARSSKSKQNPEAVSLDYSCLEDPSRGHEIVADYSDAFIRAATKAVRSFAPSSYITHSDGSLELDQIRSSPSRGLNFLNYPSSTAGLKKTYKEESIFTVTEMVNLCNIGFEIDDDEGDSMNVFHAPRIIANLCRENPLRDSEPWEKYEVRIATIFAGLLKNEFTECVIPAHCQIITITRELLEPLIDSMLLSTIALPSKVVEKRNKLMHRGLPKPMGAVSFDTSTVEGGRMIAVGCVLETALKIVSPFDRFATWEFLLKWQRSTLRDEALKSLAIISRQIISSLTINQQVAALSALINHITLHHVHAPTDDQPALFKCANEKYAKWDFYFLSHALADANPSSVTSLLPCLLPLISPLIHPLNHSKVLFKLGCKLIRKSILTIFGNPFRSRNNVQSISATTTMQVDAAAAAHSSFSALLHQLTESLLNVSCTLPFFSSLLPIDASPQAVSHAVIDLLAIRTPLSPRELSAGKALTALLFSAVGSSLMHLSPLLPSSVSLIAPLASLYVSCPEANNSEVDQLPFRALGDDPVEALVAQASDIENLLRGCELDQEFTCLVRPFLSMMLKMPSKTDGDNTAHINSVARTSKLLRTLIVSVAPVSPDERDATVTVSDLPLFLLNESSSRYDRIAHCKLTGSVLSPDVVVSVCGTANPFSRLLRELVGPSLCLLIHCYSGVQVGIGDWKSHLSTRFPEWLEKEKSLKQKYATSLLTSHSFGGDSQRGEGESNACPRLRDMDTSPTAVEIPAIESPALNDVLGEQQEDDDDENEQGTAAFGKSFKFAVGFMYPPSLDPLCHPDKFPSAVSLPLSGVETPYLPSRSFTTMPYEKPSAPMQLLKILKAVVVYLNRPFPSVSPVRQWRTWPRNSELLTSVFHFPQVCPAYHYEFVRVGCERFCSQWGKRREHIEYAGIRRVMLAQVLALSMHPEKIVRICAQNLMVNVFKRHRAFASAARELVHSIFSSLVQHLRKFPPLAANFVSVAKISSLLDVIPSHLLTPSPLLSPQRQPLSETESSTIAAVATFTSEKNHTDNRLHSDDITEGSSTIHQNPAPLIIQTILPNDTRNTFLPNVLASEVAATTTGEEIEHRFSTETSTFSPMVLIVPRSESFKAADGEGLHELLLAQKGETEEGGSFRSSPLLAPTPSPSSLSCTAMHDSIRFELLSALNAIVRNLKFHWAPYLTSSIDFFEAVSDLFDVPLVKASHRERRERLWSFAITVRKEHFNAFPDKLELVLTIAFPRFVSRLLSYDVSVANTRDATQLCNSINLSLPNPCSTSPHPRSSRSWRWILAHATLTNMLIIHAPSLKFIEDCAPGYLSAFLGFLLRTFKSDHASPPLTEFCHRASLNILAQLFPMNDYTLRKPENEDFDFRHKLLAKSVLPIITPTKAEMDNFDFANPSGTAPKFWTSLCIFFIHFSRSNEFAPDKGANAQRDIAGVLMKKQFFGSHFERFPIHSDSITHYGINQKGIFWIKRLLEVMIFHTDNNHTTCNQINDNDFCKNYNRKEILLFMFKKEGLLHSLIANFALKRREGRNKASDCAALEIIVGVFRAVRDIAPSFTPHFDLKEEVDQWLPTTFISILLTLDFTIIHSVGELFFTLIAPENDDLKRCDSKYMHALYLRVRPLLATVLDDHAVRTGSWNSSHRLPQLRALASMTTPEDIIDSGVWKYLPSKEKELELLTKSVSDSQAALLLAAGSDGDNSACNVDASNLTQRLQVNAEPGNATCRRVVMCSFAIELFRESELIESTAIPALDSGCCITLTTLQYHAVHLFASSSRMALKPLGDVALQRLFATEILPRLLGIIHSLPPLKLDIDRGHGGRKLLKRFLCTAQLVFALEIHPQPLGAKLGLDAVIPNVRYASGQVKFSDIHVNAYLSAISFIHMLLKFPQARQPLRRHLIFEDLLSGIHPSVKNWLEMPFAEFCTSDLKNKMIGDIFTSPSVAAEPENGIDLLIKLFSSDGAECSNKTLLKENSAFFSFKLSSWIPQYLECDNKPSEDLMFSIVSRLIREVKTVRTSFAVSSLMTTLYTIFAHYSQFTNGTLAHSLILNEIVNSLDSDDKTSAGGMVVSGDALVARSEGSRFLAEYAYTLDEKVRRVIFDHLKGCAPHRKWPKDKSQWKLNNSQALSLKCIYGLRGLLSCPALEVSELHTEIVREICRFCHIGYPYSVKNTAEEVLQSFLKIYETGWSEKHKKKFSQEQLDALETAKGRPSYFS